MKWMSSLQRVWWSRVGQADLWRTRVLILAFGALSGLSIVLFTWMTEHALAMFFGLRSHSLWWVLVWTPVWTAGVVAVTRRYAPGAAGSGIPQVMACLNSRVGLADRGLFVSLRLSLAKGLLTTSSILGGLSVGREGPSVQIAAGVMAAARRWLPVGSDIPDKSLMMAGGAAGIAAAFNTPLGGIMFAIEELSRRPEQRNNGLIMAAIVLAGLMGVSAYGNTPHFGVIRTTNLSWALLLPGLSLALAAGMLGGLFSRLLTVSLSGMSMDRWTLWRHKHPIRFAAGCGLAVAVMGLVSDGATLGSGYAYTQAILAGTADDIFALFALLKLVATWISLWAGVPGGVFAPSLSIGASLGAQWAVWLPNMEGHTVVALGMAAFLAAVTQAPMTAFIIVMEMTDGYNLVLSLMACSLIASGVSRLISRPLYPALTTFQLLRLPDRPVPSVKR